MGGVHGLVHAYPTWIGVVGRGYWSSGLSGDGDGEEGFGVVSCPCTDPCTPNLPQPKYTQLDYMILLLKFFA